ncbi:MAG: lactate racemase domain-containing protein [Candidatus Hodarchaeales archaeon]|jgi:nickel-dependent lactate racemase
MSYKKIVLAYGDKMVEDFISEDLNVHVLECPPCKRTFSDAQKRFDEVLNDPIDSSPLVELVKNRQKQQITIIVDDNTRPNRHTKIILPMLFEKLLSHGVKKEDIIILIASGSHVPPPVEAIEKKILGSDIYSDWLDNVIIHQQEKNCTRIGTSSAGTPIVIDDNILNAGLVISISDSEYHYFAGVAGTVKQFFPGNAGKETIARNHPRIFDYEYGFKPNCRLGNTRGNPVIEDIKEMVKEVGKQVTIFCIDAVLEGDELVILNAGNILSLHEMAVDFLKPIRVVEVDEPADLIIVSVGPLGVNIYQAGKGFHAGWNAVKQGGDVLLLAKCEQGHGNENYYQTMKDIRGKNIEEGMRWVINNKCKIETFKIGNQKPVDLLRILKRCTLHMITEMKKDELENVFRVKYVPRKDTIQESLREWIRNYREEKNKNPLVYVLPDAGILVKTKV